MRADLFLVEHGHAATRSQAQRLIAAGVRWRVDADAPWKPVAKNGDEIAEGAELEVLDDTEAKYISRGGLKLEGALRTAGIDVGGMRCLDIGQSTGGFTDCLLQQGAAQVVGIDVGHGQLHDSMRADARVVCIEGVNARSLTAPGLAEHLHRAAQSHLPEGDADDLPAPEPEAFDFLTGDLSFISLTLVLPAVVRLLKPAGHLLMLVKPQFELQPGQVGKGGIVRDAAHFEFVEQRLRQACADVGIDVLGWLDSPIAGGDGNREFFIQGRKGLQVEGEERPLAAAPARRAAKRTPRSELRALHAAHEDSEEAHAGQHGPARAKRKKDDDHKTP
jgi:23S rRNA (cytidine1920-2'-O)/16S rRNA (cytidine1409-2'-O)-methyltransferase